MNKILLVVLAFVASITISGCASYKGGVVQTRAASQFANVQEINSISVGAEAITAEPKLKEIFYVNLTEKGYFPIEVTIHNAGQSRVLVQKDQIELASTTGTTTRPINVSAMIDEFEHNKMAYALLGFGIFSYMSAEDANKKMAADWSSKELPKEIIVNSNRDVSGFVYIKLPMGVKPNGMTLTVPVENLETKGVQGYKLQL